MIGNELEIIQLGNPVLLQKAKPVDDPTDPKVAQLANDMITTLQKANGVGLAAPQVGISLRLFIVWPTPNKRYPNAPEAERPLVIINPKLTPISNKKEKDWEGCLSIPGIRGHVNRFKHVKVEFSDLSGDRFALEADDFVARIFQHENDHLDGIIFLDRLQKTRDIITEKEYVKLMKGEAEAPE